MKANLYQTVSTGIPAVNTHRIGLIDATRGLALLAILLSNVIGLGMHPAAFNNPDALGPASTLDHALWALWHVFVDGKMRALFGTIFGASLILLSNQLEKRPEGIDIYYRRTLWLLVFGILHAYFLWFGDILYTYAVCGLVLFSFRKLRARYLLVLSFAAMVLISGANLWRSARLYRISTEARAARQLQQAGKALTEDQESALAAYNGIWTENHPTRESISQDRAAWRGNFISVIKARAASVSGMHKRPLYSLMYLDSLSMMLFGMALMKWGVFRPERPSGFYRGLLFWGYGIGLPLNCLTAVWILRNHFDPVVHLMAESAFEVGRLSMAVGHLGLIALIVRSGRFGWLNYVLECLGRTAFTNYILQSMICAFLFTGYGLGWYGRFDRAQLYALTLAIWAVEITGSMLWLRSFRYGPLEWLWRSLTYWRLQPWSNARTVELSRVESPVLAKVVEPA